MRPTATKRQIKAEKKLWRKCGCSGLPDFILCKIVPWYWEMKLVCCDHDQAWYEAEWIMNDIKRQSYKDWADLSVLRDGIRNMKEIRARKKKFISKYAVIMVLLFGKLKPKAKAELKTAFMEA